MITENIRRKFFNSTAAGFVYHPPAKGFGALLKDDQLGFVEYLPNDVIHLMSYKYIVPNLSEAQLQQLKVKLDRLHAFNCGAAVTFRTQVKDLLKQNVDEYNPGLVVEKIQKLLSTHQEDMRQFAEIQRLDAEQLTINDQLLWEAQMDGRTT